jgi:hypothetical protein
VKGIFVVVDAVDMANWCPQRLCQVRLVCWHGREQCEAVGLAVVRVNLGVEVMVKVAGWNDEVVVGFDVFSCDDGVEVACSINGIKVGLKVTMV